MIVEFGVLTSMVDLKERINELRERLRQTSPNKHTMKSICRIKAQIAKLERQRMDRVFEGIGKASGGQSFDIKKTGDSNVALVGFPSVGKSTLLNKITNANSKVAAYEFTTLDAIPGLMIHKHARIMIIDLPGIIKGASKGKGFGRRILAVAKTSNLILIMLDIWNIPDLQYKIILDELYNIGIRLDRFPPLISITHLKSGGIGLNSTVPLTNLTLEMAQEICSEFRIVNALIVTHQNITPDDLIDHLNGNCSYIPSLLVCNKMDSATLAQEKFLDDLEGQGRNIIRISAETGMNLDLLKDQIFKKLDIIRIYLKPKGGKADLIEPLIVPRDSDIRYVATKIHRDFVDGFQYAFVQHATKSETDTLPKVENRKWMVGLNYKLQDFDVVQIKIK